MARDLSRFTAIAVRDTNSQAIVEKQIGKKVPITLDPTLAYDFEGEIPKPSGKYRKKYLLIYSYVHTEGSIQRIREHASSDDFKIECVGYPPPLRFLNYCDRINMSAGPFEWMRIFADAEKIITSTFH